MPVMKFKDPETGLWRQIPGGRDGASAYAVAVKNGFEGTETDWLASLKGDTGDTGPQGEKGDTGDTGPQGEKGDTGDYYSPKVDDEGTLRWTKQSAGGVEPIILPVNIKGPPGVAAAEESADYSGCYCRTVDGETEWLNPPMEAGVDYRTAERWLGKAVYVRLVEFGALPNAAAASVSLGVTNDRIVSLGGIAVSGDTALPLPAEGMAVSVDGEGMLNIEAASDCSGYTGHVMVKYVSV